MVLFVVVVACLASVAVADPPQFKLGGVSLEDIFKRLLPTTEATETFVTALAYTGGDNVDDINKIITESRRKRDIIPGVIGSLTDPFTHFVKFLFGREDAQPTQKRVQLGRAKARCFVGGQRTDVDENGTCPEGVRERAGGYLWDITRFGNKVFFGEVNNVLCKLLSSVFGGGQSEGCDEPNERVYMVEMDKGCCNSKKGIEDITPANLEFPALTEVRAIGCVERKRFPHISTGDISVINGQSRKRSSDSTLKLGERRAAWTRGADSFCVAFASEYSLSSNDDVQAFVFDAEDGRLLAAGLIGGLTSARTALAHDNRLFFGAQLDSPNADGAILEWNPTLSEPLNFAIVGDFTGDAGAGASIAVVDGRLVATTWPTLWTTLGSVLGSALGGGLGEKKRQMQPDPATVLNLIFANAKAGRLMVGPHIDDVSPATANQWTVEWDACEVDPSPQCLITGGGSAVTTPSGELVWGTMNLWVADLPLMLAICTINSGPPPILSGLFPPIPQVQIFDSDSVKDKFCDALGSENIVDVILGVVSMFRATSIFRGQNFGTPAQSVDLLYGYPFYLVPQGDLGVGEVGGNPLELLGGLTNAFEANLHGSPKYGLAGFGNAFAGYAWSAEIYEGDAVFGLFDASGQLNDLLNGLIGPLLGFNLEFGTPGADLVRVGGSRLSSGVAETLDGFGNDLNYGFRSMVSMPCQDKNGDSDDGEMLLVGTGNPFGAIDAGAHQRGGWSLQCLTRD